MQLSSVIRGLVVAVAVLGAGAAHSEPAPTAAPAVAATPADAQAAADKIAKEVEQIRGLNYKHPVRVESQSVESFREFIAQELDEAVPEALRRHYGLIVRALGLYKGPPIEDFASMMTTVMTSQVGAYYDPKKQAFFVLMNGMPDLMQGALYSHELYHALQDQHFDLTRFMGDGKKMDAHARNSDAELARTAVVEGEATYMMMLWMTQKMSGKPPPRDMMAMVVAQTSNVSLEKLREALKKPEAAKMIGEDMKGAIDASETIPAFIMDSMMGVYFKGMSFVFAVQDKGWGEVEKLYGEFPPQSTEHILHPEKWVAHEAPVDFEWPKFEKVKALRDWELMDDDVLGEFQWRIVFREQGFAKEAESASAGWGGDRYAVFKRKDSDATLLLLRTAWDSEADAAEFADVYRKVQAAKSAGASQPMRLVQKGVDVFIVEGGDEKQIDSLLKLVQRAKHPH